MSRTRIAIVVAIALSLSSDAGELAFESGVSTLDTDAPTTSIALTYTEELRLVDLTVFAKFSLLGFASDVASVGTSADFHLFSVGTELRYEIETGRPTFQLDAKFKPLSWLALRGSLFLAGGEATPRFDVGLVFTLPLGRK